MAKSVRVIQTNWIDIVNEKKIDYTNSATLEEAIKQYEEEKKKELLEEKEQRENFEAVHLKNQIEELITAYTNKDWLTCMELIVQRMGGTVEQYEYD